MSKQIGCYLLETFLRDQRASALELIGVAYWELNCVHDSQIDTQDSIL